MALDFSMIEVDSSLQGSIVADHYPLCITWESVTKHNLGVYEFHSLSNDVLDWGLLHHELKRLPGDVDEVRVGQPLTRFVLKLTGIRISERDGG